MGTTKPCTQLHAAPSTSTHFHSAPFISTQLTSTFTQLQPPPLSSFQPPSSSLQTLQLSATIQNVARNWEISPNLDQKSQSYTFWPKIGSYGILEVLIPNRGLDIWNSDPKIHFCANLSQKSQSCPFCLKIDTHDISSMLIFISILVFWISNPKLILGKFGPRKWKLSVLSQNWYLWRLEDADTYSDISLLNFQT